jgi:exodeoxyribonuclease V alpha subunit
MSALADPFEARRAAGATGLLREFNEIGVLSAADVHVATRLAQLVGEDRDAVRLAVALAVRGPRLGHVFVDLATIRDTASVDSDEPIDLSELPWPSVDEWMRGLSESELVAVGEDDADAKPLRLIGSRLYLDRYWREERAVAADLNELIAGGRLEVIAGGPGTGKTTRVARIVAALLGEAVAQGSRPPLIALAAPTGKAAARLEEAVNEEIVGPRASTITTSCGRRLPRPVSCSATSLHRGWVASSCWTEFTGTAGG